jgi:hypothetical protein
VNRPAEASCSKSCTGVADANIYVYKEEPVIDACCPIFTRTACRDNGEVYQVQLHAFPTRAFLLKCLLFLGRFEVEVKKRQMQRVRMCSGKRHRGESTHQYVLQHLRNCKFSFEEDVERAKFVSIRRVSST